MSDRRGQMLLMVSQNLFSILKYSPPQTLTELERAMVLSADESDSFRELASQAHKLTEEKFQEHMLGWQVHPERCPFLHAAATLIDHRGPEIQQQEQQAYHQLLRNRRVVIVGPALESQGKGLGAQIDAHDLVVRINFHWPVPEALHQDLGRRIDILYHCCNGDYPVSSLFDAAQGKLRFVCWQKNRESLILERFCLQNAIGSLDFSPLSHELAQKIGAVPQTGLAAIVHLLRSDLKQLTVIGFSFENDNYRAAAPSKGAEGKPWKHHQSQAQQTFVRALLRDEPRLVSDFSSPQ